MELLLSFDYRLFRFLNNLAGGSPVADQIFIILAEYTIFLMIAGLALFVHRHKTEAREAFFIIVKITVAGLVGRFVLTTLTRIFYFRNRPFVDAVVNQLVAHNRAEASFPSGHATFMFICAILLFKKNRAWGAVYFFLALVSSAARVIVGVHYPFDVVGGMLTATVAVLLTELLIRGVVSSQVLNQSHRQAPR